jgi:hypothetical protein
VLYKVSARTVTCSEASSNQRYKPGAAASTRARSAAMAACRPALPSSATASVAPGRGDGEQ